MKILVIGGSGFVGIAILKELIKHPQHTVYAVQNRTPLPTESPELEIIQGGLKHLTKSALLEIKPDVILHLGRPTFPTWRKLGRLYAGIVGRRLNTKLVKMLEHHLPSTKLVYVSGSLMYGSSPTPHSESSPLSPISYARQYVRTEEPIVTYGQKFREKVLILRVPWILGDGSWFEWIYLEHFKKKHQIPLFGDGANTMQLLLLEDLAQWVVKFGIKSEAHGVQHVYNSPAFTQMGFAKLLADELDCSVDSSTDKYEEAVKEAFTSNLELQSTQVTGNVYTSDISGTLKTLVKRFLKNE